MQKAFLCFMASKVSFASDSNMLHDAGIWAGMHTVRYFDGKTYKWVGLSRQPSIIGKVCMSGVYCCLYYLVIVY